MKKSTILFAAIALGFSGVANAQGSFGPFETNKAGDNWSIGLDAGAVSVFGGPNNTGSYWKRLGPTFGINASKWLNPNVGIRAGVKFNHINGFGLSNSMYNNHATAINGDFSTTYNMVALNGDLMYNITNAFWGYKEDRFYSAIPYVGASIGASVGNGSRTFAPGISFGFINRFRVSDAWDINVEASVANYDAQIDRGSRVGSIDYTGYGSLTVGVAYRFNQRGFKKAQPVDVKPLVVKINNLEDDLAKANAEKVRLNKALANTRKQLNTIAQNNDVIEVECEMTPQVFFFNINSVNLSNKESMNLNVLSEMIKESEGVFDIVGYADLQTGSRSYNEKLAKSRAQAVANELISKYGISADQLNVMVGDLANPPFADKLYNRSVVIMESAQ